MSKEELTPEFYGLPNYPEGDVIGQCVCGSWPGGKCLRCPVIHSEVQGEICGHEISKRRKQMIDKYTFGKTPAAIYLADRLNMLNDPKYTRKASSKIHDVQAVIADAIRAHEAGLLSIHTLNFISSALRKKIEDMADDMWNGEPYIGSGGHEMPDKLSINLMANVLIGELKSVSRRTREVKLLKTKQQRLVTKIVGDVSLKNVMTVKNITIGDVKDPTTPEILINRSRAKLKRKGLPNTLYE